MRKVEVFWIQATRSFPNGAPQREEYQSDWAHDQACDAYAAEWRTEHRCPGCSNPECLEHGRGLR